MSDEDLESTDDLSEGNGAIVLPLLEGIDVVDHDDVVIFFALIVDFVQTSVSTRHDVW